MVHKARKDNIWQAVEVLFHPPVDKMKFSVVLQTSCTVRELQPKILTLFFFVHSQSSKGELAVSTNVGTQR